MSLLSPGTTVRACYRRYPAHTCFMMMEGTYFVVYASPRASLLRLCTQVRFAVLLSETLSKIDFFSCTFVSDPAKVVKDIASAVKDK